VLIALVGFSRGFRSIKSQLLLRCGPFPLSAFVVGFWSRFGCVMLFACFVGCVVVQFVFVVSFVVALVARKLS
jgi:hypothetical protein